MGLSRRGASRRATSARLTCLLSVLVVVVGGCSKNDAPPPIVGFGPQMPVVGACRNLTAADILPSSNQTPTVPCSHPHTSITIAVGGFPEALVTDARLTNGTLGNDTLRRCTAAWKSTVGGDVTSQHLTLAGLAYYLPDQLQLSKGARWYRCDLVIGGQDGLPLQNLPDQVKGLLDGTVSDSVLACRTTPEFTTGREVPCDQKHVMRAIGTAPLPDQVSYPGKAALRTASAKGCTKVITKWLHGRVDGGDAYQWPDQIGWTVLGDHTATCWTVSTT